MRAFRGKRMKGLEPSTFCMASRRSSQLSYIRGGGDYSPAGELRRRAPRLQDPATGGGWFAQPMREKRKQKVGLSPMQPARSSGIVLS